MGARPGATRAFGRNPFDPRVCGRDDNGEVESNERKATNLRNRVHISTPKIRRALPSSSDHSLSCVTRTPSLTALMGCVSLLTRSMPTRPPAAASHLSPRRCPQPRRNGRARTPHNLRGLIRPRILFLAHHVAPLSPAEAGPSEALALNCGLVHYRRGLKFRRPPARPPDRSLFTTEAVTEPVLPH